MLRVRSLAIVCMSLAIVAGATARASWVETFDNNTFDLSTWQFSPYPDLTKTFTAEIVDGPNDNDYLAFTETSSVAVGGSAFGAGFGSEEVFTDVRVGAVVNVVGDASHSYCGLIGRATYFVDDGTVSGAPGLIATQTYVMHINWSEGPANLRIDLEKVIMMQNIMRNEEQLRLDILVPSLDNARSFYAEMDIVGSGPVYITGSIYEYKGGPLVARTATLVDTAGNDPWEEEEDQDAPFISGVSGLFGQNEDEEPAGYYVTFDDISSLSDGPAAVNPSPADGATGLSVDVPLSWLEAEFATGRELWFGKAGAMEKIDPAPTGMNYSPGPLEFNQTYEWRVDEVGPSGTVTGRTWSFTTGNYLTVESFQSYADDAAIQAAWPHNIEGFDYVFLATDGSGDKSMRLYYQNQYEPYLTEATRMFASPQDWTQLGVGMLALSFAGEVDNFEQQMYVRVEDVAGNSATVPNPYNFACQSESWRDWTINLTEVSAAGVDLTQISKLTIGMGDGTNSGQPEEDLDSVYIDDIRLTPAPSAG
jgi:hypothetical protein